MSRSPAIAAVPLGCCPDEPRCKLCAPPPDRMTSTAIRALIAHTQAERGADRDVWLGFYGGHPPTNAELAAADGRPISVRVRPDLLTRADAARLVDAGVVAIELDVLTLDRLVLRGIGRRYGPALVQEQLDGLGQLGIEVGAVIAPGLPGATFDTSLRDARELAPKLHTARIHPVLVLRHSGLYQALLDETYVPLTLGEAVTACRALLDVFEGHGVRVLRVGQQPGPDGLGAVVSGPRHPSLRELVESRRTLDALRAIFAEKQRDQTLPLDEAPPGGEVVVWCAPADVGRARGPKNQHVRTLRAEFGLDAVSVEADPQLPRGVFRVAEPTEATG